MNFTNNIISFILVLCAVVIVQCNVTRNEDICGPHNGRRLYVELGEHGVLYSKNMSFMENAIESQSSELANNSYHQCSLELVSCPSCAIVVTFKSINLPHTCSDNGIILDSPCRCDYVWISEPPYDDISGTPFCGHYTPIVYKSSTRTVLITLLYSHVHKDGFVLEYVAERNRVHLNGSDNKNLKSNNGTMGGILTSPFFPARYPRDLGLEYVITCPIQSPSCKVRVLFSDFQLAAVSIIEFYDWNGQRLDVSSGARFRPPIIVSSGPSLLIRFYANGGTGLGYKAFYSYVLGQQSENSVQPITDCGGYVENLGGTITMLDMVNQGIKTYDCVWLIRPPKNFLHMKTHMYIKVISFNNMGGNTELIIRQGPTSALLPLEILRHPSSQMQLARSREHVAPISSGFHVSLRGTFGTTSRVAIAYAAFGYMDCYSSSDYLCHNHRCIPSQLNCDGFDHCGDNSDEPSTCFRPWQEEPQDRKWHANKANYYFPKIERYPDLKTATLVFVASSLGLIVIISALIILLYRMGARARQQRELQSRLQTISELLDSARIDEISVTDDPPMYEAPPGYDEVVKVGFESEVIKRAKTRGKSHRREPRSRSLPNQRPIIGNVQATSRVTNVPMIPESPPPPYITPPGTIPRNSTLSRHNVLHISVPLSLRGNRSRRVWHRQSSLPGPDEPIASVPAVVPSIDTATIGVYLRKYSSNMKVEDSSPQPQSSVAGISINCASGESSTRPDGRKIDNHQQYLICSCEGACGCADEPGTSRTNPWEQYEERCSQTATILRLLGSGKSSTQNINLNSKTKVPKTDCSFRSPSIGRNSEGVHVNASSHTNYNTLSAMSRPAVVSTVEREATHQRVRRYSSCDVESLYESIKTLDTFLARKRNAATNLVGSQSTTLIFATPNRYGTRPNSSHQTNFFDCIRGWRSSDDTFIN